MFIDEIKVYAQAGRGGSVILQADHDLNNLIAQYYVSRLIAQIGEGGMGKGMDGHAGKDLIVKVPCGTLVWRLPSATPAPVEEGSEDEDDDADEDAGKNPLFSTGTSQRPIMRATAGIRGMEVDLSKEEEDEKLSVTSPKGELVADLTQDGQQFVLCKGGRGGLGNRNFATAARQTPRFAQPG